MKIRYTNLTARDLRGDGLADFLVNVEADIEVVAGDAVIYSERLFPVLELARELITWINGRDGGDFVLESLSFDESGAISIVRKSDGWAADSVFAPDQPSGSVAWEEIVTAVSDFADRLRIGLSGLGLDAALVPDLAS
ncbi:hypothetical protein ACQPZJ_43235 [Actinoplanes sp. CA-054009]